MQSAKPILLVEDDTADVLIIKRALKELGIDNELVHCDNGESAVEYLKIPENPKPCIVLLDLNMPRMNGIEFLKIIKKNENVKQIPVIALTTSQSAQDIADCFKNGIAGYIVKPVDFQKFVKAIRIVDLYWMLSKIPCQAPFE
jgi:CheY-like chemotaxis protein